MARTQASGYSISDERFEQIVQAVHTERPETLEDDIAEMLFADWTEGQEHQTWLDTAPVDEIASWALIGIRDIEAQRRIEEDEDRAMDAINSVT